MYFSQNIARMGEDLRFFFLYLVFTFLNFPYCKDYLVFAVLEHYCGKGVGGLSDIYCELLHLK